MGFYEASLNITKQLFGDKHVSLAYIINNIAITLYKQKHYE